MGALRLGHSGDDPLRRCATWHTYGRAYGVDVRLISQLPPRTTTSVTPFFRNLEPAVIASDASSFGAVRDTKFLYGFRQVISHGSHREG